MWIASWKQWCAACSTILTDMLIFRSFSVWVRVQYNSLAEHYNPFQKINIGIAFASQKACQARWPGFHPAGGPGVITPGANSAARNLTSNRMFLCAHKLSLCARFLTSNRMFLCAHKRSLCVKNLAAPILPQLSLTCQYPIRDIDTKYAPKVFYGHIKRN